MRHVRAWTKRFLGMFATKQRDQEIEEEIQYCLQMHIDDNQRSGMDPETARLKAMIKLGGIVPTIEVYRDRRGIPLLENVARDVSYAFRVLTRAPAFTIVAVATLALGIGANTAIFSIVNTVLLRPLPYPDSSRLMMVHGINKDAPPTVDDVSYPNFEDWRSQCSSFESIAAYTASGSILSGGGYAEAIPSIQVTPGFFEMLGISPTLGRSFTKSDGELGAPKVALIGDNLWKARFGRQSNVLGKTVTINEHTYTIIGVLPPGFSFNRYRLSEQQVCTPIVRDSQRGHAYLNVVGRLKARISIVQAQSQLNGITSLLAKMYPDTNRDTGANIEPLVNAMVGNVRAGLWVLLGVVAFVLLIACANVANLMLARAASRRKEMAVRATLGAGRFRLVQQLVVESTIIALAGGLLGLTLASWGARLLAVLLARNFTIPRIESTGIDIWVLAFTVGLSFVVGVAFGLMPALSGTRTNLDGALRQIGRSSTDGTGGTKLRGALVVSEIALALVLVAGAALLLKTFLIMRSTNPGFDMHNVAEIGFSLPELKYAKSDARQRFFRDALSSAKSAPGVKSAALVADLPLGGDTDTMGFQYADRSSLGRRTEARFNVASPGYFKTMGIPMLAGREFDEQDNPDTPGVVVINQAAAKTFWPDENPIGKRILLSKPNDETSQVSFTVVGIAGDVRQLNLGLLPEPEIFLDYDQDFEGWPWLRLIVRTENDPAGMRTSLKALGQSLDPDVTASGVSTMEEVFFRTLRESRTYALLVGIFAALALVLAAVGIYGVVSYSVTQRTYEIGVRMALGARRGDILKMTLLQGLGMAGTGIIIGVAGAVATTRLITRLVETAKPGDWGTLVSVSLLLLIVTVVAVIAPARRATAVDPNTALRYE